jgi:chaperonin GroES
MAIGSPSPTIQPLGSRVLISRVADESRTASGLLLPETAKENPQTGLVVAIGDDEEIRVKVDDRVFFAKYTGTEFRHNDADYLLMESTDILARLAE